jgi:Mg-chelatase subunit ChlD
MAQSLPTHHTSSTSSETLQVRALLERSSLRPGQHETLHLSVGVTATGAPVDAVRPALSVVFVLDGSGSMLGEPLAQVVHSVSLLTGLLSPTDKVGVVVFSHEASVVCPLRALDTDARRSLQRRLASLRAGGGTNIEAGLRTAAGMLGPRTPHERQVVLLLSDGQPNAGAATADALGAIAASLREHISFSTLGFGASHDADVLAAISKRGGGQYWFIAEPDRASVEFARALGAQSDIVADAIDVAFSPLDNVEVIGVVGQTVRFTRDGPAVTLPDLRAHQTRLTVAELVVRAPREPGRLEFIDVIVRFRAAGRSGVQTIRQRVSVDVVDRPPALVRRPTGAIGSKQRRSFVAVSPSSSRSPVTASPTAAPSRSASSSSWTRPANTNRRPPSSATRNSKPRSSASTSPKALATSMTSAPTASAQPRSCEAPSARPCPATSSRSTPPAASWRVTHWPPRWSSAAHPTTRSPSTRDPSHVDTAASRAATAAS